MEPIEVHYFNQKIQLKGKMRQHSVCVSVISSSTGLRNHCYMFVNDFKQSRSWDTPLTTDMFRLAFLTECEIAVVCLRANSLSVKWFVSARFVTK